MSTCRPHAKHVPRPLHPIPQVVEQLAKAYPDAMFAHVNDRPGRKLPCLGVEETCCCPQLALQEATNVTGASLVVTGALLVVTMFAIRNKCLTSNNKNLIRIVITSNMFNKYL